MRTKTTSFPLNCVMSYDPILQMLNILNRNWFIIVRQLCYLLMYIFVEIVQVYSVKQKWKMKFCYFTQYHSVICLIAYLINHLSLQLFCVKRILNFQLQFTGKNWNFCVIFQPRYRNVYVNRTMLLIEIKKKHQF